MAVMSLHSAAEISVQVMMEHQRRADRWGLESETVKVLFRTWSRLLMQDLISES